MGLLENINSIADLKKLSVSELPILAEEIRCYMSEVVSANGGHLSSNLGAVELTIALHYVYNSPADKIIFDVGHQSYTHKILTDRKEAFKTLRLEGGLSGFPRGEESPHDVFDTGHSGTSVSAALGYARARDLSGESFNIAAVIGDGSLGGGMVFEALNDAGFDPHKMLIILNDNKMSISKNVGGMSKHLGRLRLSKKYVSFKRGIKRGISAVPLIGKPLARALERGRDNFKFMIIKNKMFDQLGLKYIGPIDGHDIKTLIFYIEQAKNSAVPVVLHVLTDKGKGNQLAESDPTAFHGVNGSPDIDTDSFSAAAGEAVCELAEHNDKITVFSAAMALGTGMTPFHTRFPSRFFDVGISEEHAVTCAAGMAKAGFKPYVAIYSTFMQRAFDQILHDVCMQSLPVTLLLDRAGVVGEDGSSHQGIYDLSYLSLMPNLTVAAPISTEQLKKLIGFSEGFNAPLAIRYPKCAAPLSLNGDSEEIVAGKWQVLNEGSSKIAILAVGNAMQSIAQQFLDCKIVNPLFIKPLDEAMLDRLDDDGYSLIVLEENVFDGGLYSRISSYYAKQGRAARLNSLCTPDIVKHGSVESSLNRIGLSKQALGALIEKIQGEL